MSSFEQHLVMMIWAIVSGTVASIVYNFIKKGNAWLNAEPSQVHVVIMGAISFLLPLLQHYIPSFPTTLDGIDATTISQALTFLVSQIVHYNVTSTGASLRAAAVSNKVASLGGVSTPIIVPPRNTPNG